MSRDHALPPTCLPRGLNREQAAEYIGVGTTLFDQMVADGRMPPPIEVNTRKIWDRHRLDRAFDRLYGDEANEWDGV